MFETKVHRQVFEPGEGGSRNGWRGINAVRLCPSGCLMMATLRSTSQKITETSKNPLQESWETISFINILLFWIKAEYIIPLILSCVCFAFMLVMVWAVTHNI